MNEQVISAQTAEFLKERNFNWESRHYYTSDLDLMEFRYYHVERTYEEYSGYPDDLLCMAPTQALLQKWLREICSIDILLNKVLSEINPGTCYKHYYNYNGLIISCATEFFTYEEALESALFEILKLVK